MAMEGAIPVALWCVFLTKVFILSVMKLHDFTLVCWSTIINSLEAQLALFKQMAVNRAWLIPDESEI